MKLVGVKINNYKSIGNVNNYMFINKINVIVGKNESGKSNIIEGIGKIYFIGYTPESYFKNFNKNTNQEIRVELTFRSNNSDYILKKFNDDIKIVIKDNDECTINKEFGDFIVESKKPDIEKIQMFIKDNVFPIQKPDNLSIFNRIKHLINNIDKQIFVTPIGYDNFITVLKNTNNDILNEFCLLLESLRTSLENIYDEFPSFCLISSETIKTTYNLNSYLEEIDKEYDSILYQLLSIIRVDTDELKTVLESKDSSFIKNFVDKYNKLLKERFVNIFNRFYKQEIVDVIMSIDFNCLNFLIKTKGNYLEYSERSNGLKWYLNIFIQLLYKDEKKGCFKSNNIFLIDEPGVYLHPIAQKELVSLLYELSENNNQIIYTTHSPSMIDFNNIQDLRFIEKNSDGNTCIYNKMSEYPINSKSKLETITPIIKAMGYDISFNIGPNYSKVNIITEGITDYLFLKSYFKNKKEEEKYNIIASTGANNIPAIASILYGWGCSFVILLDQDDQGRSVYDSIKDQNLPYFEKIIFCDRKEYNKANSYEIEDLFSYNLKKQLGLNMKDYKDNKYFYAYKCFDLISNGNFFDKETNNNFKDLIDSIEKL